MIQPGSPHRHVQLLAQSYEGFRKLPDDICRCHDEHCPEREGCLRFLQRNVGGVHVVQASTLRIQDEVCDFKIDTK